MKVARLATILAFALSFYACGPALRPPPVSPQLLQQEIELQREMTFRAYLERWIKLQRIYTPLRMANADLCRSNISPVTGIIGIDQQSLRADLRNLAQRFYGAYDGITILDAVPDSPAAQAGLQSRDVITGAAKGQGVMPSGWSRSALTISDVVKVIESSAGNPITLLIRRAGNTFPLVLTPRPACSYSIKLEWSDLFNAVSDGNRIIVFTGLFNHVPDDREIAVIVAHELAHNVLRHIEKSEGNAAVGGAAGLLVDIGLLAVGINTQGAITQAGMEAGRKAYSQEFEFEADYLGLYMLARAGFDISAAPDLIRRMGVQHPGSQVKNYFSTHPSTPERAVSMTQAISEIQDKASRQEALLPKNLEGQALAVNTAIQAPTVPLVVAAQPALQLPTVPAIPSSTAQSSLSFVPATQTGPAPISLTPTSSAGAGQRLLAQLHLIKGPIVSNPPQAFSGEFLPSGKAQVILSGRRLLTGDFELFGIADSITAKYKPALVNPDNLKLSIRADAKGFAALNDGSGTQLECVYSITKATGLGEGTCADNQRNTYRIVFD
jgi:Peptidase family M48